MRPEEMENKPVVIVIPVRNSGESFRMTIMSIIQNFQYPYKIIIVEAESRDGTAEYCDILAKLYDFIEVYHIKAEGTTKAYNYGIDKAGDLDVLLTQDDVIFQRWIGRDLLATLNEAGRMEDCGIATVQNGWGVSGPLYCNGFKWVGTWCMYIPRKTINKIGKLDENMNPGDGDDIDYSYAVVNAGLKTYVVPDMYVDHHRKFSIDHEHEHQDIKKRNSEYFKKKWNIIDTPNVEFHIKDSKKVFDRKSLKNLDYKPELNYGHIGHDPEVFELIDNELKKFNDDDIYIDVGACVGDTAMWITKGTCFALEPSERSYEQLLLNCNLNKESKVVPLKLAAYNKVIHYKIVEGSHFGLDEIQETSDSKSLTVTLDETFKNIPNIKLIKIDCEGTDKEVLEGAIEIIKKNMPVIIIEVNHSDKESIGKIFEELNYSIEEKGVSFIARPK